MSKNLPNKIKILDKEYDIIFYEKSSEIDSQGESPMAAQIDYNLGEIRVWSKSNKSGMTHLLFHEIAHGILDGLKLPQELSSDERIVDNLATAINLLVSENNWDWIKND